MSSDPPAESDSSEANICDYCKGTGVVYSLIHDDFSGELISSRSPNKELDWLQLNRVEICPLCKGTGFVRQISD